VVVNDVLQLGIFMRNIALVLKSTLMDLCWYTFEMWFKIHRHDLLEGRQPPVALAPVGPSFILASSTGQKESVGSSKTPQPLTVGSTFN